METEHFVNILIHLNLNKLLFSFHGILLINLIFFNKVHVLLGEVCSMIKHDFVFILN